MTWTYDDGDDLRMFKPTLFGDYPDDLYGGTPPHVRGDDTSAAAAAEVKPNANTLRARVLDAITRRPSTDDELEALLDMRHQTLSARRRELVLQGKVIDSGERRATRSGRKAKVWRAV